MTPSVSVCPLSASRTHGRRCGRMPGGRCAPTSGSSEPSLFPPVSEDAELRREESAHAPARPHPVHPGSRQSRERGEQRLVGPAPADAGHAQRPRPQLGPVIHPEAPEPSPTKWSANAEPRDTP